MCVFFLLQFFTLTFGARHNFYDLVLKNSSYNKYISPFEYSGKVMELHITVPMQILVAVEEDKQIAAYIVSINMTWQDDRLKFDSKKLGPYAVTSTDLIWLPRVGMYNSLTVDFPDREVESDEVQVRPNGMVFLRIKARFETICQFEVENFPFDVQFCSIDFDAGINPIDRFVYVPHASVPPNAVILGTPEWPIEYQTAREITYGSEEFDWSMVMFTVKMKRNPQFYITFIIIPIVCITITCFISLLLPLGLASADRISLGLACFLGLAFMMSITVVEVPRSNKLPLLGEWVIVQMVFCTTAIFMEWPMAYVKEQLRKRMATPKKCSVINFALNVSVFLLFAISDAVFTIVKFTTVKNRESLPEDAII